MQGWVCSWGSSLACVDIATGQGQGSSSFLLNHERELNISAFGALVCCVMSYIWKHFDESPIQWQLHTAGLFHNTVWKGNALFHSRLSTSVDSYIAQVCLSNQNTSLRSVIHRKGYRYPSVYFCSRSRLAQLIWKKTTRKKYMKDKCDDGTWTAETATERK